MFMMRGILKSLLKNKSFQKKNLCILTGGIFTNIAKDKRSSPPIALNITISFRASNYSNFTSGFSSEIVEVIKKINEVETEITEIENKIKATPVSDKEELKYLRDKEMKLRDEKQQLRDEKQQLRDKENILLKASTSTIEG